MEKGPAVADGDQAKRHALWRRATVAQRRASRLDPVLRALIWATLAGVLFAGLNTIMRGLALQLSPFQTQFLRYVFGLVVVLPLVARAGWAAYRPASMRGQFLRGGVHTIGLCMWFTAIPHIGLADTTAISFTGPIFIMIGAALVFGEKMRWERWLAALIGLTGVLIVVAPKLAIGGGGYALLMVASSPVFAASSLMTKSLTRYDSAGVIVLWQSLTVMLFSLPLALMDWHALSAWQWFLFLACGLLGSTGHYCIARSLRVADVSATQSVKLHDLVWASLRGWIVFEDSPSRFTLIGGAVICTATIWIAQREARGTMR
jgi:drug/metabolite transporter (DMT)-like permease